MQFEIVHSHTGNKSEHCQVSLSNNWVIPLYFASISLGGNIIQTCHFINLDRAIVWLFEQAGESNATHKNNN